MCPRQLMRANLGQMSFELYKKIIDEISEYAGVTLIPFFRGESMLHRQFVEFVAYARNKGIEHIQFTTNATRLKKHIAEALIDLEIDFISFSIDSIDPDTYASIRRGGQLKKVLENIDYFCKYRIARGKEKPEIQVSVVKTIENQDQIDDFVAFWRPRVDRVRVFEKHTGDGNFGSVESIKEKYVFEKRLPCQKVFNEISIYWNGQVALCCHDWDRKREVGDVNKSSIRDIWHNETYRHIRRTHLTDFDDMEDLCKNCDQWKAYYLPQGIGSIGDLYFNEPGPIERGNTVL